MKRGREEKSQGTLPSPTRFRHGGHTDIPFDLTVAILKKLPAKSLVRFLCVSKLWSSTISTSRDFIDSIMTRSLTQPPREAHIIFAHGEGHHKICFLASTSSTCPRNTDQVSTHYIPQQMRQYVRGLIFCWSDIFNEAAIYNPTTRKTFYLPDLEFPHMASCFFGYDPLENRYKALFIPLHSMERACQVFTLGDPTWRTIQGVKSHFPMANVVCINGVINYRATNTEDDRTSVYKLISFDVRTEKFYDHVEAPKTLMDHSSTLINYQGKLGFICCENGMEIWVMENANKRTQGWSRIFFYGMEDFKRCHIRGANRGGEIVFSNGTMLCVFYYDLKRNSMRYVDLKATYPARFTRTSIWSVMDHVENTMCLYQTI